MIRSTSEVCDDEAMAHERARAAASETSEPEVITLPGEVVEEADVEDDVEPLGSIDKLLVETDQGWDIEAQVLTLQRAAGTRPPPDAGRAPDAPPRGAPNALHIPTPFELGTGMTEVSPAAGGSVVGIGASTGRPRPARNPPALPAGAIALARPRAPEPSPAPVPAELSRPGALVDLLYARIATLESATIVDPVGLGRAHMELAIASEIILGDDARATAHAEAALAADPASAAAHAMLRRKRHARAALPAMLGHLEREIAAATSEGHKVELLAETARLLVPLGGHGAEVRSTWEQVLAHAPLHAAALKGLEAELTTRALASGALPDWEALAVHLGRMADAYGPDTRLSAWLHVERAEILERQLSRIDAARGALERALELEPGVGPVRSALVRHVTAHADWGALARLLDEEALLEGNAARSARLELDAALILAMRLDKRDRARTLLERAAARAPTAPDVDLRVLDELVRLHEAAGRGPEAALARRARLRFVTDPAALAYELRALATQAESQGELGVAIADVQRALDLDATDPTLIETLDRLLACAGKQDARIAMWLQQAARTDVPVRRAMALARAARICDDMERPADAIRHLRSAWITAPGDLEVLDSLARLLAPTLSESADAGARSLVELYAQAAEEAHDPERRIAYLEKVALLSEELLVDPSRAARAFERILEIDPDRRSALLGLARTAERQGDVRALVRALLEETRLAVDPVTQRALQARAASVLAAHDPARAMQLARAVLAQDPAHAAARSLETRLEQDAGRWEGAAASLRARIDLAGTTAERVSLWLALAHLQHRRLHKPLAALEALERAHGLDATHPVPPEQVVVVLEEHGDDRALRDAFERMAARSVSPEQRAQHWTRAAEIDELRLGDDASAVRSYQRALAETPESDLLAERMARLLARHAPEGGAGVDPAALLIRQIERATSPEVSRAMTFELAARLVESGQERGRAASLLEAMLAERPDHVPALRVLEGLRRRAGESAPLGRVLALQGEALADARARLGALWNLVALEEWVLPSVDPTPTYGKLLDLDPTDPGALEAVLRRQLPNARRSDPHARWAVLGALRALVPFSSDDDTRSAMQLRLALMLEAVAEDAPDAEHGQQMRQEAMGRLRDVLRNDDRSITASTGLARLASELGDVEAAFAAAKSLAELAVDVRLRARYLVDAGELLLGPGDDPRLGSRPERRKQAADMLERALGADPDSVPAAARLATVLLEERDGPRLVGVFRDAIGKAKSSEAVVMLGSEIARVARDELGDLPVAVDAMRRARAAAPQHVPSLLTLAELCVAQRVWPEAIDALEAVVSTSRDAAPRLTALLALASIYDKVLAQPEEVDRVLRAALAIDPDNARALRSLLRRIAAEPPRADESEERARRQEVALLLARLAEVEREPAHKTNLLLELADVHQRMSDTKAAERALVEAVAVSPADARAFARLEASYGRSEEHDAVGHARALNAVIALGQQLGRVDARWFASLGRIETRALGRLRDGIAHLQRAVALAPALFDTRFDLAEAYAHVGANDDASRALLAMLSPMAHPLLSLSAPTAALALLERTLAAEQRTDEAIVIRELRALAVHDEEWRSWLRGRHLPTLAPEHEVLGRQTLVTHVLPPEGRHILLEVAAAFAGIEAKVLRADLSEIGISSRDRISSRSGHPTRTLLDRAARQLGVGEVELALAPGVAHPRVLAQDVPWVVVPTSFPEQSEMAQLVALARAVARIAYGVPWLEELPAPHVEALLVAAARQVVPGYGSEDVDILSSKLVAKYEAMVARALSRRQRKLLEELTPHISSAEAQLVPIDTFIGALARAELRAAFLVTGDLLALLDDMGPRDAALRRALEAPSPKALAAVLEHPFAGDVVRFALTPEATALRHRVGSNWTAPGAAVREGG